MRRDRTRGQDSAHSIIKVRPVTALPREPDPIGPLLRRPPRTDAPATAELALSRHDPYFYDHPLDHVPGMALVCALLDLAAPDDGVDAPARVHIALEFPSFCEHGPPVSLTHDGAAVTAEQDGRVVCAGELRRTPLPAPVPAAADRVVHLPADPALVHRRHIDNVLVTGMADVGGTRVVALREPVEGHRLSVPAGAPPKLAALLDAARQFGTMVCHVEFERPADTAFVLLGLEADLTTGVPGGVHLAWTPTDPPRGRSTMDFTAMTAGGEPLGRMRFAYYLASPSAYRRLRGGVCSA